MRVTFVLPGAANVATGGARMVFLYANRLAEAGWVSTVLMSAGAGTAGPGRSLARRLRYCLFRATGNFSPRSWQTLHPGVRLAWTPDLAPERAPPGDAVIATAVETAEAVARWPVYVGKKHYFVQGYEVWDHSEARVRASWRLPLRKIAVSKWLCGLIGETGEQALHLPNAVDHEVFGVDVSAESRQAPVVLWPYHPRREKGAADVLVAMESVFRRAPAVRWRCFGTARRGPQSGLCEYFPNVRPAFLRRLYNEAMITVAPSHAEGWGLPAAEAQVCGSALAASDIDGHGEFLRPGENALLHKPGDPAGLAENVVRLLEDRSLRLALVRQGRADADKWRIEDSARRLMNFLKAEGLE